MRLNYLYLVPVLFIFGCATTVPQNPVPIEGLLIGSWDEVYEQFCQEPHKITFSDSNAIMNVEYYDVGWATKEDGRKVFKYRVLGTVPNGLRVSLEDEQRKDDGADPVVWHIKIVDKDTYCWGRDDWRENECTPPRKRCKI